MATDGRRGKIARARIVPPRQGTLYDEPGQAIADALASQVSVERYQRLWRVGRSQRADGYLFARLGFESTHAEDLWDPETRDFEEVEMPGGVAAPFAIDLTDLLVVFQVRSPYIRINSFVGALRALLRQATGEDDWRVELPHDSMSFSEWRRTVSRVTRLRIRLERPNPNYEGRPSVETLIEGAHLSSASLDLRSENLDTDADIVRQLLDHVERGYGYGTAVGRREIDGAEVETVYSTEVSGSADVREITVDPETGEIGRDALVDELGQLSEELDGSD